MEARGVASSVYKNGGRTYQSCAGFRKGRAAIGLGPAEDTLAIRLDFPANPGDQQSTPGQVTAHRSPRHRSFGAAATAPCGTIKRSMVLACANTLARLRRNSPLKAGQRSAVTTAQSGGDRSRTPVCGPMLTSIRRDECRTSSFEVACSRAAAWQQDGATMVTWRYGSGLLLLTTRTAQPASAAARSAVVARKRSIWRGLDDPKTIRSARHSRATRLIVR